MRNSKSKEKKNIKWHTKDRIKKYYYSDNKFIRYFTWKRIEMVKKLIEKNKSVLDIGGGSGELGQILDKSNYYKVIDIIDFSEDVENFELLDITQNHLDEKFNIITAVSFFNHLNKREILEAITHIKIMMKDKLIVGLLTENIIYKIGRFLHCGHFNQPEHLSSKDMIYEMLSRFFNRIESYSFLGLYEVTVWKKKN